eukprot:scpid104901/ scgid34147/ 
MTKSSAGALCVVHILLLFSLVSLQTWRPANAQDTGSGGSENTTLLPTTMSPTVNSTSPTTEPETTATGNSSTGETASSATTMVSSTTLSPSMLPTNTTPTAALATSAGQFPEKYNHVSSRLYSDV